LCISSKSARMQDDTQYMVSYMRADFEEMHNTGQKIVCHIRNLPGS